MESHRRTHELDNCGPALALDLRRSRTDSPVLLAVEYRLPHCRMDALFKNTGSTDSPIVQDIQALDIRLAASRGRVHVASPAWRLVHTRQLRTADDDTRAKRPAAVCADGRPSDERPLALLEHFRWGHEGLIAAIGWPGQWAASFTRDASDVVRACRPGIDRFTLHAGEEIRTPLIVLQFYRGDRTLRRTCGGDGCWHTIFRASTGDLPRPCYRRCSGGFFPGLKCNEPTNCGSSTPRAGSASGWTTGGWTPVGIRATHGPMGTWQVDRTRFPTACTR